ncbi:MAG: chitobiase/beta-hexosaminidase C-terminal domain-containing protein [Fimbriimonadaceae bacterium]|nr:chitobiase/beta-hexosaminidase C-terminal domain-containing protein [Fimbriimonadaceae bacterium]
MTDHAVRRLGWLLALLWQLPLGAQVPPFADLATATARPAGAPRASDVCVSSRWPRPLNAADPRDSLAAIRAFHGTRFDWVYLNGSPASRDFVGRAKAAGYPVAGTLNGQLADELTGRPTYTTARTVNLRGEPLQDPWTKANGMRWGCVNNPDYAVLFQKHARHLVDLGVDALQMDGVQLNHLLTAYGGCFCEHCRAGFREYLAAHATLGELAAWGIHELPRFDYAAYLLGVGTLPEVGAAQWKGEPALQRHFVDFQLAATEDFLTTMYAAVDQYAGRHIAKSCNATMEFLDTYHRTHDFAQIEAYPDREGQPAYLYERRLRPAQALGKPYLLTFVSTDRPHTRRFIASGYALGANVVMPWDVFIDLQAPRYFGQPAEYADLAAFVRGAAGYLDGYQDAAVVGPGLTDPRYADPPPVAAYAGAPLLVAVRARPGERDAPVVLHLVQASPTPTGEVRLTFDARRLFGSRPLRLRYLAPPPYDAAQHAAAAASGEYGPLTAPRELPGGTVSQVELPGPAPWGILVAEPAGAAVATPWQPRIECAPADRSRERLTVRLACPTPDTVVRYTLDGSLPGAASPVYEVPLELRATTTVTACAVGGGAVSPPAVARFVLLPPPPSLAPDAPNLAADLRLWLRADSLRGAVADGGPVRAWPARVGPAATVPATALLDGRPAAPPTFHERGLHDQPAVAFDGADDLLAVPGLAQAQLAGRPFTLLLVSQSDDPQFGLAGNGLNGTGGVPRLYLCRATFHYHQLSERLALSTLPGAAALTVYQHDGDRTGRAWLNGQLAGERSDLPRVEQFGSGGHLSLAFWSGNQPHAGQIAEIVAYDRALGEADLTALHATLAARYQIDAPLRWR